MGRAQVRDVGCRAAVGQRLLIVQHNELLCRALRRYFGLLFEQVLVAANPALAELYLGNATLALTDLICGQDFGAEWPLATEVVSGWRQLCPTLQHIILVTGRDDTPDNFSGIDAICREPIEPTALCPFLFGMRK
jgi:hypothetical protein